MSTLSGKKLEKSFKNKENIGDISNSKKDIEKILSIIDFENIDEISILSQKIEELFLELFDGGNMDNFQEIHILEYVLSKLTQNNTENIKKAYEILLMIFSTYLYENDKLDNYKDSIVNHFKLNTFENYFDYVSGYINHLDNSWIKVKIIFKYLKIPANYNKNNYYFLNNDIDQKEFAEKIKESLSLHKYISLLIKNKLSLQNNNLNKNTKKLLFKYINTFLSFNNYNYILLHIFSLSETIKEKQHISKLLNFYIDTLKNYLKLLINNQDYLNDLSYRSAIVVYSNIFFFGKLIDEKDKQHFDKSLEKIKELLISKYGKKLEKSFENTDEYSQFIYYYTGECIDNGNLVKKNNESIIDILDSHKLGEDLFVLTNILGVHTNIKKTAKAGLLLMPSAEKDKLIINQKIFSDIGFNNANILSNFKKQLENGNIKEGINIFLRYLGLLLNIEYNKQDIDLKFFVDKRFINEGKIFENLKLNVNDISQIEDFNDYLIKDNSLYIKFNIKTIYGDSYIIMNIDGKNIQDTDVIKQQIFNIEALGKIISQKIFNYLKHISNFEQKIIHLKNYHEETFNHMTNIGILMYNLAELIKDKKLDKLENYYQNQFCLDDKKEIYKIIGYMHDIGKANIADRLNRYSGINSRVDFFENFYNIFYYIFKNPDDINADSLTEIDVKAYFKNIDTLKNNINKDKSLNKMIEKIILNTDIISMNENFYQKLIKEIISLSILKYKILSKDIGYEKIINNKNICETKEVKIIKEKKIKYIEMGKIQGLDLNKFLWIVLGLIKITLDKIIKKIKDPHIQESFDFVKIEDTFISLTSIFFHHSYPDIQELKKNGILDILKNNYKNIGVSDYLNNLQNLNTENLKSSEYPNDIKDPIMVITNIIDIMEALIVSNRGYQKNSEEMISLKEKINNLHINKGLKNIILNHLKSESKEDFEQQYPYVLNILDRIFKDNKFYKRIRPVLELEEFKEKVKSI